MKISQAVRGDLPRILFIQKEAYVQEAEIYDDYSIPPLLQSLEELESEAMAKVVLKAEVDGEIVGSVRVALTESTCLVGRLIVAPKFQKRGIGSALLVYAESMYPNAQRFELFTGTRSVKNIRLYERHGYVGFREEVISPAVTLVYMCKIR